MYLLGQFDNPQDVKEHLEMDIRGEITVS